MDYEIVPILEDIVRALEKIENHLNFLVKEKKKKSEKENENNYS